MANQNLGADPITATTSSRDSWQEALSKWQTVPAARVSQAAEVIRGMAGSWAASHQMDTGSYNESRSDDANVPNPSQYKISKIGQPGHPEINFAPYNWGTNRFGSKGGSFVGHPISFSVVGPTLKNSYTGSWQWTVTSPGGGDELQLNQVTPGDTVTDLYGIPNGVISATDYPGGLYMVISQTGGEGNLPGPVVGGIGDGCVLENSVPGPIVGYTGLTPVDPNAKYEIFRIIAVRVDVIILDPNKRLANYFTIPANPVIRAITILQPQATRLVAVPGSSSGGVKESQAFAVVPPRRALGTDERYPYNVWTTIPNWTEDQINLPLLTGSTFDYAYGPKLPIPRPVGNWKGRLHGIDPVTGLLDPAWPVAESPAGTFILMDAPDPVFTGSLVGKILHITSVQTVGGAAFRWPNDFEINQSSLMGWFEVTASVAGPLNYWVLRRMEENNPALGFSRTGSGEYYSIHTSAPAVGKGIFVEATVHDPVTDLWSTRYADIDKIQSARLTNIIDPRWVERSMKSSGLNPGRADRAVFDTAKSGTAGYANPGSLMDLGFRMVLFPAKVGAEPNPLGGPAIPILVPDWDNPVTSNELMLDSSKNAEKQYVEVDYSNGLVRFSHPIKDGPLYPSDPTVFTSTDNPRGEMVLFACCVPYSMEEGQLGANIRVTGGHPSMLDGAYCGDTPATKDTVDAFSNRIVIPVSVLMPQVITSQHVVDMSNPQTIALEGDWTVSIPGSGFFELIQGDYSDGDPAVVGGVGYRGSLFGYRKVALYVDPVTGIDFTILGELYGGGVQAGGPVDSFTIDAANPHVVVFRREVVTPNDLTGVAGVNYQFDTTYGSAKRSSSVRFDDADVVANTDGSVTVRAKGTQTLNLQKNLDDMFSSWHLKSTRVTASALIAGTHYDITIDPATILMQGQRMLTPQVTIQIPSAVDPNIFYFYFEHNDGTTCPACYYTSWFIDGANAFPLPHPEDILIAKVVVSGGVATVMNLQNPIRDMDKRLEITVGEIGGTNVDWISFNNGHAHFKTLGEAVGYASEMMAPESGGPAYKQVRIRVIGRTLETVLPIEIKTNGLVIEGMPLSASGINTTEISWDDATKDLIDLNGRSDLVFRDLAFRFLGADPMVATNSLFITSSGPSSNVIIDNCRANGYVYNFLKAQAFVVTESRITSNHATSLRGDGIHCVQIGSPIANTIIEGNLFGTSVLGGRTGTVGIKILHDDTATFYLNDKISNVTIRNNYITGFGNGIWVGGGAGIIDGNYINGTLHTGLIAAGGVKINNNNLSVIHTGLVDMLWGFKYGILVFTKENLNTTVGHNSVDMDVSVVGNYDDGIHVGYPVLGSPPTVSVHHNTVTVNVSNPWHIYVFGYGASVQSNVCNVMKVDGTNCYIAGNYAYILAAGYDVVTNLPTGGSNNTIVGNTFANGYVWDGNTVEGNTFGSGLCFHDDCKLIGNTIATLTDYVGLSAGAVASLRPIIANNVITSISTGAGTADKINIGGPYEITGNRIAGVFEILDANFGTIGDNTFAASLILGRGTLSSYFTVTGNTIGSPGLIIGDAGHVAIYGTVTGNQMQSATGLVAYASKLNFTGNSTCSAGNNGTVTVVGAENVIASNTTGAIDVTGTNNMITGNQMFGGITVNAASGGTQVAGNNLPTGNTISILSSSTMIFNNIAGFITFGENLTHAVITGNMVTNSIVLGSAAAAQVDPVVLTGNMILGAAGITNTDTLAAKVNSVVVVGNVAQNVFAAGIVAGNVDANNGNV